MPKVMFGITLRFASEPLNATESAPFIETCFAATSTGRFRPKTISGLVPTTTFLSFTAAREFAAARQVVRFFGCC
jgi:hypothetical protein